MSLLKYLGYTAGGLALAGGGLYLYNLSKFGNNVVVDQVMKVSGSDPYLGIPTSIVLTVIPTIKNPTRTKLTLTQPYVEMRLNESDIAPLASSQQSSHNFDINPLSETTFDPIVLKINILSNITSLISFATKALKEKKITLYTKTTTVINQNSKFPITFVKPDKTELKF